MEIQKQLHGIPWRIILVPELCRAINVKRGYFIRKIWRIKYITNGAIKLIPIQSGYRYKKNTCRPDIPTKNVNFIHGPLSKQWINHLKLYSP